MRMETLFNYVISILCKIHTMYTFLCMRDFINKKVVHSCH